jgi:hypothetical protein
MAQLSTGVKGSATAGSKREAQQGAARALMAILEQDT